MRQHCGSIVQVCSWEKLRFLIFITNFLQEYKNGDVWDIWDTQRFEVDQLRSRCKYVSLFFKIANENVDFDFFLSKVQNKVYQKMKLLIVLSMMVMATMAASIPEEEVFTPNDVADAFASEGLCSSNNITVIIS